MSAHVDNFLIIGNDPEAMTRKFVEKFLIRTQCINPGACLGLQWEDSEKVRENFIMKFTSRRQLDS